MINVGDTRCPVCGGYLKPYDHVKRIVRTKGRKSWYERIRRMRCLDCRKLHNELPDYIFPYKQYEAELIRGVLEGLITSDILGYEEYPCELTMKTWKKSQKLQGLLWKTYVS